MFALYQRKIRDEKIKLLQSGQPAYAESQELIRLIKRDIQKYNLQVHCETTNAGCWFTPIQDEQSG